MPIHVSDVRVSEEDIPHYRGIDLLTNALDNAPAHLDLSEFPDVDFMSDSYFSFEDQSIMMEFYKRREADLHEFYAKLLKEYELNKAHAERSLTVVVKNHNISS